MVQPARILHLDDNPQDAQLIALVLEVEHAAFPTRLTTVQSKDAYLRALRQGDFDIILSDYRMPGFDGDEALQAAQAQCPDTPFIMVTGELGEERVIETLQRGATDYVLKDRIFRLVPAIRRALSEAENQRKRREAEAEVRRAHRETSEILESIQDGFYVVDKDWQFTYVNARAEALLGKSRQELTGRRLWEAFPQAIGQRQHTELLRAMQERGVVHFETVSAVLGRWVEIQAYPKGDGGLSVVFRDISERKEAQEKLQEREQTLRSFYNSAPLLMGVAEPLFEEQDIMHIYDNPASSRFFQTPGTTGRRASEMGVPAEAIGIWLDWYRRCEELGEPVTFEYEHTAGGKRRWLTNTVSLIGALPNGRKRFSYISADITEQVVVRRRLEQEEETIRESEQRIRATFENAAVGIVEVDEDDRILAVNNRLCRILGYRREEMLGMAIHDLTAPEDRSRSDLFNRRLHEGDYDSFTYEKRYMRSDGTYLWVHVAVSSIRDARGNFRRAIGTVEDISERKAAEEEVRRLNQSLEARVALRTQELERANRDLEAFSYTVSHDLRSPLRLVNAFAGLLRQALGEHPPEQQLRALTQITEGIARMERLINALLEFSRVSGKPVQKGRVNMRALIERVAAEQHQLSGRDGALVVVLGPGLPEDAEADPVLMQQVVVNLLANAVKYTRPVPAARIVITAVRVGTASASISPEDGSTGKTAGPPAVGEAAGGPPAWLFCVQDNGVGFPSDHAGRLFQVFQRLHSQAQFEGTGIGLANVRKIIERHGGRVWAEGEEGKGAAFYFTLPIGE